MTSKYNDLDNNHYLFNKLEIFMCIKYNICDKEGVYH